MKCDTRAVKTTRILDRVKDLRLLEVLDYPRAGLLRSQKAMSETMQSGTGRKMAHVC